MAVLTMISKSNAATAGARTFLSARRCVTNLRTRMSALLHWWQRSHVASLATLLGLFALTTSALPQPASPHIGYVYPAGGRQGAVFPVAVRRQYSNNATNAFIAGTGVQAAVVAYSGRLTHKDFNVLREKLQGVEDKRAA